MKITRARFNQDQLLSSSELQELIGREKFQLST